MVMSETLIAVKNHWKKLTAVLLIVILIIASYTGFALLSSEEDDTIVTGILFINGQVAPEGIFVKIQFSDVEIFDLNGTDSNGEYEIDVGDHFGETGTLIVLYGGDEYIAEDEFGNSRTITFNKDSLSNPINAYVTIETDSSENDDDDDDIVDEGGGDENPDEPDDPADDDPTDDDPTDDDSTDDDPADDEDPDDDEDSDDDTDPDDDPTDDDDPEHDNYQNITHLTIESLIWNEDTQQWKQDNVVSLNDMVQFNLSITYNGSYNLTNIQIKSQIPNGISYLGNSTINGTITEPYIDTSNNTLQWNITTFKPNQEMIILFNTSIQKRGDYSIKNTVDADENNTMISYNSTNKIQVMGTISVEKKSWDSILSVWTDDLTVDLYDPVRINITVLYNGSFTITDLEIEDSLPDEMNYMGNCTVNDLGCIPQYDENTNTVLWDTLQIQNNTPIFIEFDVNVSSNKTFINTVEVTAEENISSILEAMDNTSIKGKNQTALEVIKNVRHYNQQWKDYIEAYVNDTVQFKITIKNNGNATLYNLNAFDTLPKGLYYKSHSCQIFYNGTKYIVEPYINEDDNFILWSDLNTIIANYFNPGDYIDILFNTTVKEPGLLINKVLVSSTLCNECDSLNDTDYAYVNATIKIPELEINAGGPYNSYENETITLNAEATGGIKPYTISWDLDDDGQFDDATGGVIQHQWPLEGNYTIHVKVEDNASNSATDTTLVRITLEPLVVDAGGPYESFIGEPIQFTGQATGGSLNYTWNWEFGDGNESTLQNPIHNYTEKGIYQAILTVTDDRNNTKNDTAQVLIHIEDNEPPEIIIVKPIDAIYLRDRAVFPFFTALIIGDINITIIANDNETEIEKIDLYIDDQLIKTSYIDSMVWYWNERIFKKKTIEVIAYDIAGNSKSVEQTAWKLF